MELEQYSSKANASKTVFTFVSEGPKGKILKRVQYEKIHIGGVNNIYNLGFGDSIEGSEEIDDFVVSANQDRDKVLATVVNTIYTFTEYNPEIQVFLMGNSPAKKRLYQMVVSKYFDALSETFHIKGLTDDGIFDFEKNVQYLAFLVTRKIKQ